MSESEVFSKLDSIKKCPIYNEELERGYIIATHSIRWDVVKRKHWIEPAEILVRGISGWIWEECPNVTALRCERRGIVIFSYKG